MGTPLREVIRAIGGGPRRGRTIKAVLSGVANAVIPASALDAPVSYEGLRAVGSGIGSGGFIVLDDTVDMVAVAAGVSRFLAVESCGQCMPCKLDGITLAKNLITVASSVGTTHNIDVIRKRLGTVADRSRCFLATQHQVVVGSIFEHFADEFTGHLDRTSDQVEPELIAELIDIQGGAAVLDERHRRKQPDWSYNSDDSGTVPVELYQKVAPPWRAPDAAEGLR
jgi:NADH:ubiquinone oxidoreductase subunit F (NADH-binding)